LVEWKVLHKVVLSFFLYQFFFQVFAGIAPLYLYDFFRCSACNHKGKEELYRQILEKRTGIKRRKVPPYAALSTQPKH